MIQLPGSGFPPLKAPVAASAPSKDQQTLGEALGCDGDATIDPTGSISWGEGSEGPHVTANRALALKLKKRRLLSHASRTVA